MPIVDYKHNAELAEKQFFEDKTINNNNKEFVRQFLEVYNVSHARKSIFLKHIKFLLQKTNDISKDMKDRDKMNKTFKDLRESLGSSYYSTIVNVSLRFCRWLNDKLNDNENKPKGFKDIKNTPKKAQKRSLNPSDMITWADGLKLIKQTMSIQIKAVLMTQLDGGLRPSEFIDLKHGDCVRKKDFIIVTVKDGKTGSRLVTLYKSVPYLQAWLNAHPTKKKDDPLWLQEKNTHGEIIKFHYPALQKRIRQLGERAGIDKPLDFYNLRHSACVISKLDNVPEELAAAKFGHSIEYYTGTYGRLSSEDNMKRYAKVYGNAEEENKKKVLTENIVCQRCDKINPPNTEFCEKCNAALSLGKALEVEKEGEDKIKSLTQDLDTFKKEILDMFKAQVETKIKTEIGIK